MNVKSRKGDIVKLLSLLVFLVGSAQAATISKTYKTNQATMDTGDGVKFQASPILGLNGSTLVPMVVNSSGSLVTVAGGQTYVTRARNVYSSTNVTTGAWVELVASTPSAISVLEIYDSSTQTLEIGIGAAAAEVAKIYIIPGGNRQVPLLIPAASRISVRAVSATASTGELTINMYQ